VESTYPADISELGRAARKEEGSRATDTVDDVVGRAAQLACNQGLCVIACNRCSDDVGNQESGKSDETESHCKID